MHLSIRTKSSIKVKKEESKISKKGKKERIISQNIIKKVENLLQKEVIAMNTKRVENALLEITFHEKFNINKFWSLKKNVFKNDIQHKFAIIDS